MRTEFNQLSRHAHTTQKSAFHAFVNGDERRSDLPEMITEEIFASNTVKADPIVEKSEINSYHCTCPRPLFSSFPAYHQLIFVYIRMEAESLQISLLFSKIIKAHLFFNIVVRFKYMDTFVVLFTCRLFQLKLPRR